MRKLLLLTTLLAGVVTLSAQTRYDKEPYTVNHFNNAKVTQVNVETTGGNISVTSDNATETRVEVYVTPNNSRNNQLSKEEIRKKLEEDYTMNVSFANNKLTAIAKRKRTDGRDDWEHTVNVSFKVFVPRDVTTELRTSGGNISLSNLTGNQDFRTSGGNLVLENMGGTMKGVTSGGNINVKNSKDNINLTTSGGNITAENNSGKMVLSTSGGNLNLSDMKGDIHATTSGGNVHGDHISGDFYTSTSGGSIGLKDVSGSVEASTSAGNIELSATDQIKKIVLSNSTGNIYLQLPANKGMDLNLSASNIRTETLKNFKGTQDKERIDGSINGGGITVRAHMSSGNIRLGFN